MTKTNQKKQKFNQYGKGYYFSVQNPDIGGQMEVSGYPDHTPPIFIDKLMDNNTNLVGGSNYRLNLYNKIYNPSTNRMVNITSKTGTNIIKKYLQISQFGGYNIGAEITANNGPPSVFDPNMVNRQFGCKQPTWEPNCT